MEELDLKELIAIFMKKKVLIILVVVVFALIGAIYTLEFITPKYQSKTTLVLVQTGNGSIADGTNSITTTDVTLNSKLVENYKEIAQSESIAKSVIDNLKLDMDIKTLQDRISVTSVSDTELLKITVEDIDPQVAYTIAKEVANVFIARINEIYSLDNVHVLDEAELPTKPSNVHLVKNIVIFAFVGGILVSGYILLINMLDTTVKSDTDIEKALEIPVLASIVLTSEDSKKKFKNTTSKNEFEEKFITDDDFDQRKNKKKSSNNSGKRGK